MSTILGTDGKPAAEPETSNPPPTNGQDRTEVRDVRTVPTGVLMFNLCLCANALQMNRFGLDQARYQMAQQRIVIEPPEVQALKAAVEHHQMARDVMIGELNFRFREIDVGRMAAADWLAITDRPTPAMADPEAPVPEVPTPAESV